MFTLRKATKEDAELIYTLALQVFPHTYREILPPEQSDYMMGYMYTPVNTRQAMDDGYVYFILAQDGQECGYSSIIQDDKDLFILRKIYILPDYQGRSAGKFLFQAALAYIRQIHPEPFALELKVHRSNKAAVAFYEKMGMTIDRAGDFPIGNGFFMNDYIMRLEVKG
ncbi:MAG: GNAT family N-acetyltransferase [Tannerella sp.]|nr:GNAT family N-acetyltransferase [Tannerella sp.]